MTCICVLTAFRPSFPHLETLKKILENSTLTVRKKKKIPTDRPNFQILVGWGQHNNFFFLALSILSLLVSLVFLKFLCIYLFIYLIHFHFSPKHSWNKPPRKHNFQHWGHGGICHPPPSMRGFVFLSCHQLLPPPPPTHTQGVVSWVPLPPPHTFDIFWYPLILIFSTKHWIYWTYHSVHYCQQQQCHFRHIFVL